MSIKQNLNINIVLVGDGSTDTVSIDLTNYIRNLNVLPNTPSGLFGVSATSGVSVASSSLIGNLITATFTAAPTAGLNFGFNVSLLF